MPLKDVQRVALVSLGMIDEIAPEPRGGAQLDYDSAAASLDSRLHPALESLLSKTGDELREHRYLKFRSMGCVTTLGPAL